MKREKTDLIMYRSWKVRLVLLPNGLRRAECIQKGDYSACPFDKTQDLKITKRDLILFVHQLIEDKKEFGNNLPPQIIKICQAKSVYSKKRCSKPALYNGFCLIHNKVFRYKNDILKYQEKLKALRLKVTHGK